MTAFRFRMQSVMKLRERQRDQAAQALEQAQRARLKLLDQIEQLQLEREHQNTFRGAASVGQVDVQRLIDTQRYQLTLIQQINGLTQHVTVINQELAKRRALLVEREQSVKSLENLRREQLQAWQANEALRAQAGLDEWASLQHFQQNREV